MPGGGRWRSVRGHPPRSEGLDEHGDFTVTPGVEDAELAEQKQRDKGVNQSTVK